ncbi:MAG: hypothetical protein H6737_14265 [Alphaproteobacteria bacterium]|nr:hypothetical protein [Alphaproteobacteria bacterium]
MEPARERRNPPAERVDRTAKPEALEAVLAEIARDVRERPEDYLKETRAPDGGE